MKTRKYYFCEAEVPSKIYTETEKIKSVWPGSRFGLIGEFTTREKADAALADLWAGNGYWLKNNDGEEVFCER